MKQTQPVPAGSQTSVARRWAAVAAWTGARSRAEDAWDTDRLDEPSGRPGRVSPARELGGLLGVLRLPAAVPRLAAAPRGDGHTVIDVPGWKAPESTGWPIRSYLRSLGYRAQPWGLGTNEGDPERDALLLTETVRDAAESSGRPVSLIGWSLGGIIAREVARENPHLVRRVITYGTPAVGGPTHTAGYHAWPRSESARIAELTRQLDNDRPIAVPLTVILTLRDGIVAPAACVDRRSALADHVQVSSTHLGLIADPDVWLTIAQRLALPVPAASATA